MDIVTGVDGSEPALQAARTAARLAGKLGASLHVLSAYGRQDVQKVKAENLEFVVHHEQDAQWASTSALETLRSEFPDVDIQAAARPGKPGEALVAAAEDLSAELIVVGNKRTQGLARVLGSIASDVVSRAPCDVYIVHTYPRR